MQQAPDLHSQSHHSELERHRPWHSVDISCVTPCSLLNLSEPQRLTASEILSTQQLLPGAPWRDGVMQYEEYCARGVSWLLSDATAEVVA